MVSLVMHVALVIDCAVMLCLGFLIFADMHAAGRSDRADFLASSALLIVCLVTAGATAAAAVLA